LCKAIPTFQCAVVGSNTLPKKAEGKKGNQNIEMQEESNSAVNGRKRGSNYISDDEFYCRYYHGNKHRFGVDYYEFELYSDSGYFKYINRTTNKGLDRSTRDRNDYIVREMFISPLIVQEFKKIVSNSGVLDCSDKLWPEPSNDDGKQELEIRYKGVHVSLMCVEIFSLGFVETTNDVDGLTKYFHVIQDLKSLMSTLLKHNKSYFK
jgi:protein mago nashi